MSFLIGLAVGFLGGSYVVVLFISHKVTLLLKILRKIEEANRVK
jgi:hypothetical protein